MKKGKKKWKKGRNRKWKNLNKDQQVIQQGSGGYATRIRRLYDKDQEVLRQESGGYTTKFRRLYNKNQEVIRQGSGGYLFQREYSASPYFCWTVSNL